MSKEHRGPSRRTLLLAFGAAVAADQLPRLPEFIDSSKSEIYFDAQQIEIRREKHAASIVFGGSNFANADKIADWAKPPLELLGGVGSVSYAKDGLDTMSIAKRISALKRGGITEFSFYLSSIGAQIAGKTILDLKAMGEDINIKHIFLDCTPPSHDYIDNPALSKAAEALPPLGGATGLSNLVVHKGLNDEDGVYAGLWDEQLGMLNEDKGEYYLQALSDATNPDTPVSLLTPADPEKDTLVNAFLATRRLRQIFPNLRVYPVYGDFQQHGIYGPNVLDYHKAMYQAIADAEAA